jgi:hypothetical protein
VEESEMMGTVEESEMMSSKDTIRLTQEYTKMGGLMNDLSSPHIL